MQFERSALIGVVIQEQDDVALSHASLKIEPKRDARRIRLWSIAPVDLDQDRFVASLH